MKVERARVFFEGRVQGVGFRYTCRNLAMGFSMTGYVRNLSDGRVELMAEGERSEIEDFLDAIDKSHLKSFLRKQHIEWKAATGEWKDFHIED